MKKKIKKAWQSKFLRTYIILLTAFLMLEIIFRLISGLALFSYASLRIFLLLNILSLLFAFIASFFARRVARVFNPILVLLVSIYGIAELGFKSFLGVYASISASTQAEAVTSYIWDFIKSFHWSYYLMLIPFLIVFIYYVFIDKKVSFDLPKRNKDTAFWMLKCFQILMIVFASFAFFSTLKLNFMQNKKQAVSSYDLFLKPNNPSMTVSDFGFIGFGLLDVKEYYFPGKERERDIFYDPSSLLQNSNNNDIDGEISKKSQTNIDDEIWIKIIENEPNSAKNNLNKYFISAKASNVNEYTGILENKNIIMILVESGSDLMVDEKYFPNMAKMYQEGWSFENYYSPRNTCSTGNNEFSNLTGLYTIYNNCTANVYSNNTYFESLFNLFNNKGYTTNSYHDHIDQYYSRAKIHKGLGVNDYYNVNRLGLRYGSAYGDWASDVEFIKAYLKILDKRDTNKPFMSFLTTVSSHQPYNDPCSFNYQYLDMFPKEWPSDVRSYMSKLKLVDNAMGELLEGLEKRDLLEDTVIVIMADHYPYAISQSNLSKAYGYDISKYKEAEKVPFIIYNSQLNPDKFDQFTEHVNTTPTIANLFALDFDSRLYVGSDVLDENYESVVVFDDGSWKNDVVYYDASTNKPTYYTQKVYSDEEILAINEKISLKLEMSSLAIKSNYFSYLKETLDSYKSTSEKNDDN